MSQRWGKIMWENRMEQSFRLEGFLVQPDRNRLVLDGVETKLEPRVMRLLATLAQRPGETVTRQALMAALWQDVHVTDDALNRCVWKLRKALGNEDLVETVPKLGYQIGRAHV